MMEADNQGWTSGESVVAAATVLIVDDDQSVLKITQDMLRQPSYLILTAENGRAALDVVERQRVDLVLSEVELPGMSGSELVSRVKQASPSTAVMLMTGFTEQLVDPEIPLLEKPFPAKVLRDRVREVLAVSRAAIEGLSDALQRSQTLARENAQLRGELSETLAETSKNVDQSRRARLQRDSYRNPEDSDRS